LKALQRIIDAHVQSPRGQEGGLAPAGLDCAALKLSLPISRWALLTASILLLSCFLPFSGLAQGATRAKPEYLFYESEDMRGFATQPNGEPVLNPSWLNLPQSKARGWDMNGTGTSAEWTQGGESGWNSAAASAEETHATIYQDLEIPRAGNYRLWVRYADWANKTETFSVVISQEGREVFRHEFGTIDRVDAHDEVSMYWQWAFTWDNAAAQLAKGSARVSIAIEKASQARRQVDCFLLTNDAAFVPMGRSKPDFAGMRYLREWSNDHSPLSSLLQPRSIATAVSWQRPKIAGRDFLMPWNIAPEFWKLYDEPVSERPLFPFNAEPLDQFLQKYKGVQEVPLFSSKLVVPVVYINDLAQYLKENSPFLRYVRETKTPFAILINYGSSQMSDEDGRAAWKLLNGELKDQFLGWISGESIGHVFADAPQHLKVSGTMSRRELLDTYHTFYTDALARKWAGIFHTDTGAMCSRCALHLRAEPRDSSAGGSFITTHLISVTPRPLLPRRKTLLGRIIFFTRVTARRWARRYPGTGKVITSITCRAPPRFTWSKVAISFSNPALVTTTFN
jgi:hypothetical protein